MSRSVTSGDFQLIVLKIHTEPSGLRTMKEKSFPGTLITLSVPASPTTAARQLSVREAGPHPEKKTTEPNKAMQRTPTLVTRR